MQAQGAPDVLLPAAERSPDAEPRAEIWFKRKIDVRAALADLWRSHELVVTLAERDLRVRYKQALLGFAWAVFTPLILMLVFTVFFTQFAKVQTAPRRPVRAVLLRRAPALDVLLQLASRTGAEPRRQHAILNKVYCPRRSSRQQHRRRRVRHRDLVVVLVPAVRRSTGFAPKLRRLCGAGVASRPRSLSRSVSPCGSRCWSSTCATCAMRCRSSCSSACS